MDATPNTVNYMIGGYVVFAVVMVVYILSLYTRWRSLQNEQKMLEEMEKQ
jgi:hypothetical protein